jgi:electron transport complex protein RnfB
MNVTAEQIDALLPQTQCAKCGYPGCRPYAEAVADGTADINQCPPGGSATIDRLANLTGLPAKPLNPAHGTEQHLRSVAVIDEARCIGCVLCIKACPVDAILGAPKLMHTVIADECTGCELCVAPCPVDCIKMVELAAEPRVPVWASEAARRRADHARSRHAARQQRLQRLQREREERRRSPDQRAKRDYIAAAVARVAARKAGKATPGSGPAS